MKARNGVAEVRLRARRDFDARLELLVRVKQTPVALHTAKHDILPDLVEQLHHRQQLPPKRDSDSFDVPRNRST